MVLQSQQPHQGSARVITPSRPDTDTTSLSSSFSSSAASSMIPVAAPSSSSLSDINSSDHSAPLAATAIFPSSPPAVKPPTRSSSLALPMGQALSHSPSSTPASHPSQSFKSSGFGNVAVATGNRLKRAFAGRRKKTEEPSNLIKRDDKEREVTPPQSGPSTTQVTPPSPRNLKGPGKLTLQLASQVLGSNGKKQAKTPTTPHHVTPLPPVPPPKPVGMQNPKDSPAPLVVATEQKVEQRASLIAITPGISSALALMRADDEMRELDKISSEAKKKEKEADAQRLEKEAWRKSDSTMSHHTIRPGMAVGNRTSRPVSMAESLQSNHTVVPANKRLSALLTDADFTMPEEDDVNKSGHDVPTSLPSTKISPTSSLRTKKRRSMSLNIASPSFQLKSQTSPALPTAASLSTSVTSLPSADLKPPSKSISEGVPISATVARDTPTLTRAAATGIISSSGSGMQSTSNNIRGRLVAWTAATGNPRSASQGRKVSSSQNPEQRTPHGQLQVPSLRQTAISMTAPAAGLAKRAVERMGRALGGMSSSSSTSGYSSSSSGTAPSSYSNYSHAENSSGHAVLNPTSPSKPKRHKRTPNAPSGSWSVTSSITSSISEADMFPVPTGPVLGERLRGPLRESGGIVFGKDLRAVAVETAVHVGKNTVVNTGGRDGKREDLRALERRKLPALVVRCAQHILIWGIQEEGLFRVNGRPSHVSKLRSEFDTGADYDMTECAPGDLDPHAVASVFKAYLRELPEPILTHSLVPYFDAAMTQESSSQTQQDVTSTPHNGTRGPSLPSGPRSGLPVVRKPPSLSTLAMPSFSGLRPPSESLLNALRSLIAELPQENRDLIRTVTELIKATAQESKETKMPLSNLLLVFCPSLNMNPPLLRVLCQAADIWDGPKHDTPLLEMKQESIAILPTGQATMDVVISSSELEARHAASPEDTSEDGTDTRNSRREPVSTVYLDTESDYDDSSSLVNAAPICASDTTSLLDDASYVSTSEGDTSLRGADSHREPSSPQLSSSVESLATPSTSSDGHAFTGLDAGESDFYVKRSEPGAPIIADMTSLPLSVTPGRPTVTDPILAGTQPTISNSLLSSSPIQFPASSSVPPSPVLESKRSFPVLSLPSFSPFSGSGSPSSPTSTDNSSPSSRTRKLRKPSLHLLFNKRSASPLASPSTAPFMSPGYGLSPYLQPPRAASDSSISTPISAVTAPQSSTYTLPHVLGTPTEPGSLSIGLNMDEEDARLAGSAKEVAQATKGSGRPPRPLPAIPMMPSSASLSLPGSSKSEHSWMTPIAERYRSTSSASLPTPSTDTRVGVESSIPPVPRLEPLTNNLQMGEDWSKSVLMAADIDRT